ncbi:protein kinase [Pseudoduganella plicata]|uniref:Protein kinase domain-containing protein n=1 Tax=Pseudoduganella plicata TaxID=321984 RepID=A0A4P7B966_9BURK|nr:protein kinase [Pseudoduganella plicata]QBQ35036.1 hypothetical protein E1742_01745 [Pseudoduganella plicata]GGZ06979.1 hypothetical protein GCM10007388_45730 [Pseudoduganella plicata]
MQHEHWWPRPYRFDALLAPGVARARDCAGGIIVVKQGGVPAPLLRLRHPHLAAVVAADCHHHVLAWAGGVPMARLAGRVPVAAAVRWTGQLLAALACLHDAGVVHRDVTAANAMVVGTDAVLIDYGLAAPPGSCAVAGTPASTAPEGWRGHADARSDLFAVGVLLYRLLTGRHPFPGPPFAALQRILHGPVAAPSTQAPQCGSAFDPLLARALAARPSDRFASAAAMAAALDAAQAAFKLHCAANGGLARVAGECRKNGNRNDKYRERERKYRV